MYDPANRALGSLERASTPRLRWDDSGEAIMQLPENSHVQGRLLKLLRSKEDLDKALEPLMDISFIRREGTIRMPQLVQELVRWKLQSEDHLIWLKQSIGLVAHAFPEDVNLDIDFEALRSELTPHVFRCLRLAETRDISELEDVMEELVSMLLSALGSSGKEDLLLDQVERYVQRTNNTYHRCIAAKWRAYM